MSCKSQGNIKQHHRNPCARSSLHHKKEPHIQKSLRVEASWSHNWYEPKGKGVTLREIVRGPFTETRLSASSPHVLVSSAGKRWLGSSRRRVPAKVLSGHRAATLRTGIPDPWAEYLTFGVLSATSERIHPKELYLWSDKIQLVDSIWHKLGIPLNQGIPDPWENWPKGTGWQGIKTNKSGLCSNINVLKNSRYEKSNVKRNVVKANDILCRCARSKNRNGVCSQPTKRAKYRCRHNLSERKVYLETSQHGSLCKIKNKDPPNCNTNYNAKTNKTFNKEQEKVETEVNLSSHCQHCRRQSSLNRNKIKSIDVICSKTLFQNQENIKFPNTDVPTSQREKQNKRKVYEHTSRKSRTFNSRQMISSKEMENRCIKSTGRRTSKERDRICLPLNTELVDCPNISSCPKVKSDNQQNKVLKRNCMCTYPSNELAYNASPENQNSKCSQANIGRSTYCQFPKHKSSLGYKNSSQQNASCQTTTVPNSSCNYNGDMEHDIGSHGRCDASQNQRACQSEEITCNCIAQSTSPCEHILHCTGPQHNRNQYQTTSEEINCNCMVQSPCQQTVHCTGPQHYQNQCQTTSLSCSNQSPPQCCNSNLLNKFTRALTKSCDPSPCRLSNEKEKKRRLFRIPGQVKVNTARKLRVGSNFVIPAGCNTPFSFYAIPIDNQTCCCNPPCTTHPLCSKFRSLTNFLSTHLRNPTPCIKPIVCPPLPCSTPSEDQHLSQSYSAPSPLCSQQFASGGMTSCSPVSPSCPYHLPCASAYTCQPPSSSSRPPDVALPQCSSTSPCSQCLPCSQSLLCLHPEKCPTCKTCPPSSPGKPCVPRSMTPPRPLPPPCPQPPPCTSRIRTQQCPQAPPYQQPSSCPPLMASCSTPFKQQTSCDPKTIQPINVRLIPILCRQSSPSPCLSPLLCLPVSPCSPSSPSCQETNQRCVNVPCLPCSCYSSCLHVDTGERSIESSVGSVSPDKVDSNQSVCACCQCHRQTQKTVSGDDCVTICFCSGTRYIGCTNQNEKNSSIPQYMKYNCSRKLNEIPEKEEQEKKASSHRTHQKNSKNDKHNIVNRMENQLRSVHKHSDEIVDVSNLENKKKNYINVSSDRTGRKSGGTVANDTPRVSLTTSEIYESSDSGEQADLSTHSMSIPIKDPVSSLTFLKQMLDKYVIEPKLYPKRRNRKRRKDSILSTGKSRLAGGHCSPRSSTNLEELLRKSTDISTFMPMSSIKVDSEPTRMQKDGHKSENNISNVTEKLADGDENSKKGIRKKLHSEFIQYPHKSNEELQKTNLMKKEACIVEGNQKIKEKIGTCSKNLNTMAIAKETQWSENVNNKKKRESKRKSKTGQDKSGTTENVTKNENSLRPLQSHVSGNKKLNKGIVKVDSEVQPDRNSSRTTPLQLNTSNRNTNNYIQENALSNICDIQNIDVYFTTDGIVNTEMENRTCKSNEGEYSYSYGMGCTKESVYIHDDALLFTTTYEGASDNMDILVIPKINVNSVFTSELDVLRETDNQPQENERLKNNEPSCREILSLCSDIITKMENDRKNLPLFEQRSSSFKEENLHKIEEWGDSKFCHNDKEVFNGKVREIDSNCSSENSVTNYKTFVSQSLEMPVSNMDEKSPSDSKSSVQLADPILRAIKSQSKLDSKTHDRNEDSETKEQKTYVTHRSAECLPIVSDDMFSDRIYQIKTGEFVGSKNKSFDSKNMIVQIKSEIGIHRNYSADDEISGNCDEIGKKPPTTTYIIDKPNAHDYLIDYHSAEIYCEETGEQASTSMMSQQIFTGLCRASKHAANFPDMFLLTSNKATKEGPVLESDLEICDSSFLDDV